MASIGILGGMGPQASNLLLSLLIDNAHRFTAVRTDEDFPDIVLLSIPVPNFTQNKNNQKKALKILKSKLPILESAHTTINAMACNTAHLLLPELQQSTSLQFLHMPNLVVEHAKQMGYKKVGLLASQTTVISNLYCDPQAQLQIVTPNTSIQSVINNLIYKQIRGTVTDFDKLKLQRLIDQFKNAEKLETILLGCTELPVIVGNSSDGITSSLHILADALLENFYVQS